jgi:hypothetical protein
MPQFWVTIVSRIIGIILIAHKTWATILGRPIVHLTAMFFAALNLCVSCSLNVPNTPFPNVYTPVPMAVPVAGEESVNNSPTFTVHFCNEQIAA